MNERVVLEIFGATRYTSRKGVIVAKQATTNTSVGTLHRSRQRLIVLLVAVIVIVALAATALFIYLKDFYVSKADYQQFSTQTDTVIARYNTSVTAQGEYFSALRDASASQSSIDKKATSANTAYKAYLDAVTQLGQERALKDEQIKKAYDAFAAQQQRYVAGNQEMESTLPVIRAIALKCSDEAVGSMDTSDLSKLVAAYDKAVTPCVDSMKSLAKSQNADAAEAGKKSLAFFDALRDRVVKMQAAYKADKRDTFKKEYEAFIKKTDSFATDTDISKALQYQDAISPADELNDLARVAKERIG